MSGDVRGQLPGVFLALAPCWVHGKVFEFDPDTVTTVRIDPQTGRPPDVDAEGQPCRPEPGADQRAIQVPICDNCIRSLNAVRAAKFPHLAPIQVAGDQ